MKVQLLAEGGQYCTRDLAGQTPDCSLLIVIACVCCGRVPLGEEGGIWNPRGPLTKQIQVPAPGVWEEGLGGLTASACLGQQEGWRPKGSPSVTVTQVTFFVTVAEATSLLPLEILVPV